MQKKFLSKGLEFYARLEDKKVQPHLITKLYKLKAVLKQILPNEKYKNIGERMDYLGRNVYINEFYFRVFEAGKTQMD